MKSLLSTTIMVLSMFSLINCATAEDNIESPSYIVLEKSGSFEIREYDSYVTASTYYDTNKGETRNDAFMTLFRYISGANDGGQEISMTAPVTDASGVKIDMTAPVFDGTRQGKRKLSFMVPKIYNINNVPQPTNSKVFIEEVPRQIIAANRYSWFSGESKMKKKAKELREWLNEEFPNYEITSDAMYAGYNAPFTLPNKKRHEMMFILDVK